MFGQILQRQGHFWPCLLYFKTHHYCWHVWQCQVEKAYPLPQFYWVFYFIKGREYWQLKNFNCCYEDWVSTNIKSYKIDSMNGRGICWDWNHWWWQEMLTSLPLKSHGVNAVSNRHNSLSAFIVLKENYFKKMPNKTVQGYFHAPI